MNKVLGYRVGLEVNGEYLGIRTLPICYDKTAYNFDEIYQQKFDGINRIVSSLGIPVHDGYNIVKIYFGGEYNGQPLPPVELEIKNVNVDGGGYFKADLTFKDVIVSGTTILYSQGTFLRNDSKFEYIYLTFGNYSLQDTSYSTMYAGLDYRMEAGRHRYYYLTRYSGFSTFLPYVTDFAMGFPYGDGESDPKGGEGEMTDESEPIEVEAAPTLFVGQLFRAYRLNAVALSELSAFLISNEFIDSIKKIYAAPMDYLTSLIAIPYSGFSATSETIKIGNVETSITADRISNFIADFDCGEIELKEYFQAFLDYSPYTTVTVYLPFIGYTQINVDAFQNDVIKVKYRIDCLTGACVAFISNSKGLIATREGNCAYHIPLRSSDYSQFMSGMLNTVARASTGNIPGMIAGGAETLRGFMKPTVSGSGSLGANTGVLSNRTPYIIIERPRISVPKSYGSTLGYASQITAKLGDLTGYTQVEQIHLNMSASDEEKQRIERLLKEGVIL